MANEGSIESSNEGGSGAENQEADSSGTSQSVSNGGGDKAENQYDILFSNQGVQLDNLMSTSQAMNNTLTQAMQNAISSENIITGNATQGMNLSNNNALHLSNALNSSVVRQVDLAADNQWNKDIAEAVADNLLIRGTSGK